MQKREDDTGLITGQEGDGFGRAKAECVGSSGVGRGGRNTASLAYLLVQIL